MNSGRRHVVFCGDRNYLPYLGVTAFSLLTNNAREDLAIFIITDEVGEQDNLRFERLSSEFKVPITIYRISEWDKEALEKLKVQGRFVTANYYRLLIPRVIPETVDTALYLDADMIVNGDISGLLDAAVGDKVVGACPDPVGRIVMRKPGYFNSGLLLMNLEQWRQRDISGKAMACAASRNDLAYCEQDALNEVVSGDSILWIDLEYNYMVYDRLQPKFQEELNRAASHVQTPKILHFTGEVKPWHAWYIAEHKDKYFDYARRSPWHDAALARDQPANLRQEIWLAEAAEKGADFRRAAYHYKRVAQHLLKRS